MHRLDRHRRVVPARPLRLLRTLLLLLVVGPAAAGDLVVHYHRPDGRYEGWNLWVWPEGEPGAAHAFAGVDEFGAVARVDFADEVGRAGFIVRKGEWERKDVDFDRFVELDSDGVTEVWLLAGDPEVHVDPRKIDRSLRVRSTFLDRRDRILLATTAPLDADLRERIAARLHGPDGVATLPIASVDPIERADTEWPLVELVLSRPIAANDVGRVRLEVPGIGDVPVVAREVLDDPAFFAPESSFGAICTPESTRFATWSPVAESVTLLLEDSEGPISEVPLERGERGTWSIDVPGDLHGLRYRYRFEHYGRLDETSDIHAFASQPDEQWSIVADLARLAPDGWGGVPTPTLAQPTDEVLYEIHVRDFSIADVDCPPERRGTYLGLVEGSDGETATGDRDGVSSGLDHLLSLGITAVHLMPVHDFSADIDEYNWGYWTAFFNVPEANFATDPEDSLAAIEELRAAVQGLHAAGIRVVLDVVYNHTSSSGVHSPFERTVPGFWFRTTSDGTLTNDAGCGNSVADERAMVREYILDSMEHWLRNYRVDGFRIDLLGTHTPETAAAIVERVRGIRPDATLYGEPWTGGGPIRFGKGSQRGTTLAVFNDHFRNALRGDLDGDASGFANGPGGDRPAILRGAMGAIDDFARDPIETVNYVSAHDNLSLLDKIAKAAPDADPATVAAMQKLSLGLVLMAQGIPFLEGGSEICRTKDGDHNSYVSGDAVNRFDWPRKRECRAVEDYVRGLIAFRKDHPALRMTGHEMVRRSLRPLPAGDLLAWRIDGRPSGDDLREIVIVANGEGSPQRFEPPRGRWKVYADAEVASAEPFGEIGGEIGGEITLPPYSMLVVGR
ncbi:MAG: type I pullulanase [Phycisphaerales bacterium]